MRALAPNEGRLSWLVQAINELIQGRNNAWGEVTLTLNQATTTVTSPAFPATAIPIFTPLHANAAAELGAGTMYVSSRANGSFVITHANSATANRTFGWVALGG